MLNDYTNRTGLIFSRKIFYKTWRKLRLKNIEIDWALNSTNMEKKIAKKFFLKIPFSSNFFGRRCQKTGCEHLTAKMFRMFFATKIEILQNEILQFFSNSSTNSRDVHTRKWEQATTCRATNFCGSSPSALAIRKTNEKLWNITSTVSHSGTYHAHTLAKLVRPIRACTHTHTCTLRCNTATTPYILLCKIQKNYWRQINPPPLFIC